MAGALTNDSGTRNHAPRDFKGGSCHKGREAHVEEGRWSRLAVCNYSVTHSPDQAV